MKRALISVVPMVALFALGCGVAFDEPEPFQEETLEHSEELDQVDALGNPTTPPEQQSGSAPLDGQEVTSGDGTGRPDPDPWFMNKDPNRPDPDPWATPQSPSTGSKE